MVAGLRASPAAVAVALGILVGGAGACTTFVVGKKASSDGSVLVTHSDDAETNPDPRLCYVPAATHPPNSRRYIYWDPETYPRYVGWDRGTCYEPKEGQAPSEPIGSIPQVNHTFALFEANYGLANEHGVGIGESTCSGVFGTRSLGHGGQALMSIDTLSRIALERTRTSRSAVELMGALAVQHGFYGANSFEGTAESLMVGDPDEAFIFHILPDPTGTTAIWAAQRVPDDHCGVVANMFVIREIDFADKHTFLFSETVRTVAREQGWWKEGTPLDFTAIYSDGEYAHKFYSGRRMWGAYGLFGIKLNDTYGNLRYDKVYPVTAKPSTPLDVTDLFKAHRYYYQGTKYDMTKGLAAGDWGNPDRWTTVSKSVKGNWERSIGIFRTDQTHVVQSKRTGQGTVFYYAPHASSSSVFVPIAARATAVPAMYMVGHPGVLSRESAYWAHKYVFNVAKLKYNDAMKDIVALQSLLEVEGVALVGALDAKGAVTGGELDEAYRKHAERVLKSFWALPDKIIEKYADGYLDDRVALGYPDWWLRAVGYENGPPPVPGDGSKPHPHGVPELPPEVPDMDASPVDASSGCDDVVVERCLAGCPRAGAGLASCAAQCTRWCSQTTADIVV